MFHQKTSLAARGKWKGILIQMGIPATALVNKHGPCPICGGADRFRWDNKDQRGTYICSQCGPGDGQNLAMQFTGRSFQDVSDEIDAMLGNIKPDADQPKRDMTPDERRALLLRTYAQTRPVEPGDLVHAYLASRGIDEAIYPAALRFGASMNDGEGGVRPAMVAMVGVYGEVTPKGAPKYVSMHRTFLRPDGLGKAEMTAPRRMMPGELPDGACVPLSTFSGGALGIAEGIETAMSASALYGLPVWAALSSAGLRKWFPPAGCTEVAIFGDSDPKFGGQAAAYHLAHRLAVRGVEVTVHLPPNAGEDWNDIHMRGKK